MWTNLMSKKKGEQEQPATVAPPTVPVQSENIETPHVERRSWASVMRLPSFSSPSAERTSSATLGEATAAARSSFHSDDGERPSLLRRSSTDSSRDPCEQHADCLGAGAEGISSLYTSATLRPRKHAGAAAAEASFDLDHVYNNWPSA